MYFGNETLAETIRMFRNCKLFVSAHGGGESNIIFMPKGGVLVEIRPDSWPMPCFIDLADNVGIQHYLLVSHQNITRSGNSRGGKQHPEMYVEVERFLPRVDEIIRYHKV